MLFKEQNNPTFSKMITFRPKESDNSPWMCSVRLDGFGFVMDIGGETREDAISNADFVIERLNSHATTGTSLH